jgi:hypothetical protein
MPSPASSSSSICDNLQQFEAKFDKIQNDIIRQNSNGAVERLDSILMNGVDGQYLIQQMLSSGIVKREFSSESPEILEKRNSDLISLDGES